MMYLLGNVDSASVVVLTLSMNIFSCSTSLPLQYLSVDHCCNTVVNVAANRSHPRFEHNWTEVCTSSVSSADLQSASHPSPLGLSSAPGHNVSVCDDVDDPDGHEWVTIEGVSGGARLDLDDKNS